MSERRLIGYRIRLDYGLFTLWLHFADGRADFSLWKEKATVFETKELALKVLDKEKGCPFFVSVLGKIVAVYRRKKHVSPIVAETDATIGDKTNGGIVCDVADGPCACGASHKQ